MSKGASSAARPWLQNGWFDVIAGCGALTAPLMLAAYPFRSASIRSIDQIFYALVLICNYPHYAATIERAYRDRREIYGRRIVTIHITALLGAALIAAHVFPRVLPWLYTAFLTWSPFHFMSQNYGITTMFVRRSGAKTRRRDRNLLYFAFFVSYAMVFLSLHAHPSPDPYVISLGIPAAAGVYARYALAPVFVIAGLAALVGLAKSVPEEVRAKAMLPCWTLFVTEFLWFVLPPVLEAAHRWEIAPQRYAGGLLALLHSAQYLWVASYLARQDRGDRQEIWNGWKWFGAMAVGGIALFLPGPWIASRLLHQDYVTSSLAFIALVNLHHFFIDSSLWPVRNRRTGLLPGEERAPESDVRGALGNIVEWLRGSSSQAQQFRRAAAVALIALAALDQARYFLASDTKSPAKLHLAVAIDPYDSTLWLNIASAGAAAKHPDEAIAALKRAVEINPNRFDAQRALALYYIEQQRYAEADAAYESMRHFVSLDAGSWANFGLLESQRHNVAQAIEDWKRAAALDPRNAEVQLYLGEANFDQGQFQEAVLHYEKYLTLLQETTAAKKIPGRTLGITSMKVATAYENIGRIDRAHFYNEKAAVIFEQLGESTLESVARFHLADTLYRLNRPKDALRNYQAGLDLDSRHKDDPTAGADWFLFAKFLKAINAPPRFVLTAYLESERLLGDKAEPGPRKALEKEMGKDAENVHKELDEWVHAALTYKMETAKEEPRK